MIVGATLFVKIAHNALGSFWIRLWVSNEGRDMTSLSRRYGVVPSLFNCEESVLILFRIAPIVSL